MPIRKIERFTMDVDPKQAEAGLCFDLSGSGIKNVVDFLAEELGKQ